MMMDMMAMETEMMEIEMKVMERVEMGRDAEKYKAARDRAQKSKAARGWFDNFRLLPE